jgi:hypothetical protein
MRRTAAHHRPSSTAPPADVICSHARVAAYQVPAWASYENPRWRIPLAKRPGYGLFAFALATLREYLPTPFPTIVRTGNLPPEIDGYCVRRPSRFVIQIDRKLTCESAIGVLIHEWAHARAWNHILDGATKRGLSQADFEAVCHGPEPGARVFKGAAGVLGGDRAGAGEEGGMNFFETLPPLMEGGSLGGGHRGHDSFPRSRHLQARSSSWPRLAFSSPVTWKAS